MAKSKGNFFTLRDLLEQGHDPAAIRYLLISVPYRQKLNFTFDGLHAARQAIDRLSNTLRRLDHDARLSPARAISPQHRWKVSGWSSARASRMTSIPPRRWPPFTPCYAPLTPPSTRAASPTRANCAEDTLDRVRLRSCDHARQGIVCRIRR